MSAPSSGAVPPRPRPRRPPFYYGLWTHLPPAKRRRLLWLLSQLLERQLRVTDCRTGGEGRDEPASPR
jgi:hypothetical protein